MKISKSLGAAALALAAFSAQAQSSIQVLNGSFEFGSQTALTGWAITSANLTPTVDFSGTSGSLFIDLDSATGSSKKWANSSISQTISGTGLVTLSFWYMANSSNTGSTNQVNFALGGFTGSVLGGSSNSTGWQQYSEQVNLNATGSTLLSFTAAGTKDGIGGYIDNVSVTAVPEPESYAMLLAGLGLMGTIALRRNKNRKG